MPVFLKLSHFKVFPLTLTVYKWTSMGPFGSILCTVRVADLYESIWRPLSEGTPGVHFEKLYTRELCEVLLVEK